jgi:magnesium-protoporphyrin O-methyltransferase
MMAVANYQTRRGEIETYFDRTAADAWKKLTSDAPVSGIRATVRKGRDQMRATLLSWLPDDLHGARVLDAGCGTGAFAVEAAKRGAKVTAIDLSKTLVDLARERLPSDIGKGHIDFDVGDMLDPKFGTFDYVVAMDSLIHYRTDDLVTSLGQLAPRVGGKIVFTFAPSTVLLEAMHAVGKVFPKNDRAPSIVPTRVQGLVRKLNKVDNLQAMPPCRTRRISSGFYTSQAMELVRR